MKKEIKVEVEFEEGYRARFTEAVLRVYERRKKQETALMDGSGQKNCA